MTKKTGKKIDFGSLSAAVAALPDERRDAAGCILKEILFLDGTLAVLKEQINESGPVIKSARVMKENPALRAYNTSIQRYSLLFKQIVDLLPEPPKEPPSDPLLDFVKGGV